MASGYKNKEVGSALSISERTVKTHLTNVFQKLGVRDRVGLVMYALKHGLAGASSSAVGGSCPHLAAGEDGRQLRGLCRGLRQPDDRVPTCLGLTATGKAGSSFRASRAGSRC